MKPIAIEQLSDELSQLVEDTRCGEQVLFTQDNVPVAQLVYIAAGKATRKAGSAKHLPHFMSVDFNGIPEGFEDYVPHPVMPRSFNRHPKPSPQIPRTFTIKYRE